MISLENTKKEIKESWKSILGFSIVISLMASFTYYEFSEGSFSAKGQYRYMIDLFSVELECEVITSVPENYYSGKINSVKPQVHVLFTSPFIFGSSLSDEQLTEIQQFQINRFKELPCYNEWLALNIDDVDKWGLQK